MPDSPLDQAACQGIFDQVTTAARSFGVSEVEAIFTAETQALTRFANNAISQNVAERGVHLSVRPLVDGRTARAFTNRLDPESIRNCVEQAIAITRLTEPDPKLLPLAEPEEIEPVDRWFEGTANAAPVDRAEGVGGAIHVADAASQNAAGIYSTGDSTFAVFNSRGVAALHRETMARFSITAMSGDGSGWAKASACNRDDFDPLALARSAVQKSRASQNPRELAPGRYTVILEPAAVLDLAGQMFGDFSGTAIADGRSFLNDRLGSKLFGGNVSITDDVRHPLQSGPPFDAEGVARRTLKLVENGEVREIAYCRSAAIAADSAPTGHGFPLPNEIGEAPANAVIAGGDSTVEKMIASTDRGILVTRLWYIREVDPYEKIFTGMTRDGTFLVENGEVVAGIRNFRFNQGLMEMLSNVELLGAPVRSSGEEAADMVVPAMKVNRFNFTEVTRF